MATGRKKLVIDGVTNDVRAAHPALNLVRHGFEAQVVAGAGASPTKMADDISLHHMERGGVTRITTNVGRRTLHDAKHLAYPRIAGLAAGQRTQRHVPSSSTTLRLRIARSTL